MSTLAHHGLVYVPLGYGTSMSILTNLEEIRGGTFVVFGVLGKCLTF